MGNNNKYVLRSFAALSNKSCRKSNASRRSEAKYAKMEKEIERREERGGKLTEYSNKLRMKIK